MTDCVCVPRGGMNVLTDDSEVGEFAIVIVEPESLFDYVRPILICKPLKLESSIDKNA